MHDSMEDTENKDEPSCHFVKINVLINRKKHAGSSGSQEC